jgi:hypothetical protein
VLKHAPACHQRGHTVRHADEAAGGRRQREGNRDELEREIDRGEPSHVEAQPIRGEQAERPVQALE